VTWTEPAADWRNRFNVILPSHLLQDKDRGAEMRNGYTFSGGPWILDHWTKGEEIKLVPNPRYWGKQPNLEAVVFKVIPDATAYLQAYKTGQIDMAFVQGAQPETAELRGLRDTAFNVSVGLTYEFLLFNASKAPVDSMAVRQALAYATDRDAIVKQLSGTLKPDITPTQAFMSPANRQWYSEPFKKYGRELAKVNDLMRGAGWAKGTDGVWAKGDQKAKVEISTATGNSRRELTEQILQSQWKEAGFEVTLNNAPSPTLNGDWLPKGTFQIALFGIAPATTDPGNGCTSFCSRNIPSEATGYQGGNVGRVSSPAIDAAWAPVNTELDDARRMQLVRQAQQALADEVPALPIAPVLDVVIYNTAKIGGPVKAPPPGAFTNLNEWYCKTC
jgi:peptide/nickel transport system substrate-binding protein